MEKSNKREKILKVSGLVALFIVVFGLSYALFTVTLNGTKKVKISTGRLELQLLDSNNNPIYITDQNSTSSYEINLDNQVPISDEVGLGTQAFEFKLKNTGNLKASYTIYLDDVALESGETRIDDEYIRYSLTKNGSEENPQALTSRELDKGTIDTDNTTYTYTLKIWIAEDADNAAMDKVFNATLRVEGTQYVAPTSEYGEEIAETQLTDTITATYYQPETTGYNDNKVKRMSNVEKIDNEERYEGGTLVISGEGEAIERMNIKILSFLTGLPYPNTDEEEDLFWETTEDYWDNDLNAWSGFKYNPSSVIIEEGITSIGDSAFDSIFSISTITLPDTLETIGDCAFTNTSIETVIIPKNVTSISNAFADCRNLREVYIPRSVVNINNESFDDIDDNHIFYCETQQIADLLLNHGYSGEHIIVDPSKFE